MTSPSQSNLQHPKSRTTIFLDQPPSCLQFCPEAPDCFIIGTYLLSETKSHDENGDDAIQQNKTGSLQLWKLDPVHHGLSLTQRVSLPYAVFDLQFHPSHPSLFAIATSTGCIALFNISVSPEPEPSSDSKQKILSISHIWTRLVNGDENLRIPALFLSWAPPQGWFRDPRSDGLAVTFSDGRTSLFAFDATDGIRSSNISEMGIFNASETIEVWFVALASFPETKSESESVNHVPFMFTSDDFGTLYTRRFEAVASSNTITSTGTTGIGSNEKEEGEEEDNECQVQPIQEYSDRARCHTAGVTSILPLPVSLEDSDGYPLLLTGSYDEYLRLYHATRPGKALEEINLGGGVWRLQLLSYTDHDKEVGYRRGREFLVLASCMHAGTRVVRITWFRDEGSVLGKWAIGIVAEFTEHESMNYASDVWKGDRVGGNKDKDDLLCVSSSFYDRRVCAWRVGI